MQPYLGPPASPIPMQPFVAGGSRFLGPTTGMLQTGAHMSGMFPQQTASIATSRTGGGVLSKLLGAGRFGAGALGGGSGVNFATILTNTQRVMGITQQVAPMIQQYGPFIKSVPTLWKMMRSMSSSSGVTKEEHISKQASSIPITNEETQSSSPKQLATKLQAPVSDTNKKIVSRPYKRTTTENDVPQPKLYV
ncbi:VrrA/YqfQ family protein [Shouchella patagoniensis]|uniref:VrrA/YqfQ family protein n=1 Tax=Shouchella patagoniensis TaxID=228576 RepID=UPI0014755AAE|nr:VrrA/YqfQ family protein [Shouchella patagoniensis]